MFKKIKSMATGVANKVKGFVSAKETEMAAKSMNSEKITINRRRTARIIAVASGLLFSG